MTTRSDIIAAMQVAIADNLEGATPGEMYYPATAALDIVLSLLMNPGKEMIAAGFDADGTGCDHPKCVLKAMLSTLQDKGGEK